MWSDAIDTRRTAGDDTHKKREWSSRWFFDNKRAGQKAIIIHYAGRMNFHLEKVFEKTVIVSA